MFCEVVLAGFSGADFLLRGVVGKEGLRGNNSCGLEDGKGELGGEIP